MSLVAPFVLATALGISADRTLSSVSSDALNALAKATYIETGMDKNVERLEKKYVSKPIRKYGGWITTIIKIQKEQKISYEWTF